MAELILVRHAETAWSGRRYCGRTDLPLTEPGIAAARRLGRELAGPLADGARIITSPLLRTRQTADAIAATLGSGVVEVDDRWAETDFGLAEGLTFDELAASMPEMARRLVEGGATIDWPGGEPAAALRRRVEAALRDLATVSGTVIVVSHGGPIRLAIALAQGTEPERVQVPPPASAWGLPGHPVLPFRA